MAQRPIPSLGEGFQAFVNQMAVLRAVVYREATARFSRKTFGIVEDIGGIVLLVVVFVVIRMASGLHSHRGMELIPFITTGVLNFWTFRQSMQRTQSFHAAMGGYIGFPMVTPLDVAFSRTVLNTVIIMAIMVAAIGIMRYLGWSQEVRNSLMVFAIMLCSGFLGFGCGILFGALMFFAPPFRLFNQIFMRLLMWTSGAFFVIPEIPYRVRLVAIYNPLLHLNDLMRSVYFSTYETQADIGYVVAWMLCVTLLALCVERAMRPWSMPRTA